MSVSHDVFYSNKVEILYNRLKMSLFNSSVSPFCRRLVIVPSPAIKSWLMLRLADDPEVGIAAGIEVAYLDQTISQLCHFENVLSTVELTLAIESEIREVILSSKRDLVWDPLFKYLKVEKKGLSKKSERRLIALSQKLAVLFKDYGIYGASLVKSWEEPKVQNWQIALWKRLFDQQFNYPAKMLQQIQINSIEIKRETRLYIFSISFMPKIYQDFLNSLSEILPVSYFQLSPCQLFWTDILSDRESRRLQEYWKKRGISKNQESDLEQFLRQRNALLANFGRLGREMAQLIEESSAITEELYALPASIKEVACYQELLTEDMAYFSGQAFSALDMIQADMALLRNPQKEEQQVVLDPNDSSIQVHAVSSKLRECQVVYDLVMGLIEKHADDDNPICPEDIIVMAPDIMDYQALIKAVFGAAESQLDYHVLDLHMPAQNEMIQAFMHLLNLPKTRWESLSLLQLFEYRCFQDKQCLKAEDIQQLGQWVVDLRILWGFDPEHRSEILSNDYGSGLMDCSTFGSWENGFSRLLSQAVDEYSEPSVSGTKLELAGQWIFLIRTLKEDLKPITNNASKTLKEWILFLRELAEKYLGFDEKNEDHQPLFDQLYVLNRAERAVAEKTFSFATVYALLKDSFNRERISFRETHLHAVRFCSMLPMRAIPAKVIVLMGMHEGAFPKQDQHDSLNLIKGTAETHYCPSATDYDRYLFLEALLSARQYFIATYLNTCSESGKEQPPSLLITELLSYLDQACLLGAEKPSKALVTHHPYHAYDQTYFASHAVFKSHSLSRYKASVAFYQPDKQPQHLFVKDFSIVEQGEIKEIVIDLRQLSSMAKNPLKAFLNNTLGVFLKDEENPETEEELLLSPLDRAIMKREAIYKNLEDSISEAEQKGKLPPGVFKEVAVAKVTEDFEDLKAAYQKLDIRPEEVFTIEFSEHCKAPVKIDNNWTLPPLEFLYKDGVTIKITGTLPEVCPKGLLSHNGKKPDELPKIWPEFLVFQNLVDQHQLSVEKNLFLMKAGEQKQIASEDSLTALRHYMDYYFLSLSNVSPLQPSWATKMLEGDQADLNKAIQASVDKEHSYDETLLWLCRQGGELDSSSMEEWHEHAERLFSEPMQQWMT